ncbi:YceI family protein [Owenweeksia hongkongensis]|uniref:YceI family protein n=1 Tax=Owenweeksia hongkongensis TaxID=253245 RepID=UPI003A94C290
MKALFLSILITISFLAKGQKIETSSSKIIFEISNFGINTVEGEITGMTGTVDLKKGEVDVCVKPATVSTGIEKRDDHLKTTDFFNVDKYPEICFVSSKLENTDKGYLATGRLTLHGQTKTVKIPLAVSASGSQTILKGEFDVNRFDYGLGAEAYDGTFQVGEIAKVKITCVVK